MSIQHSSNFQNRTMRTMISLLEISKERLMEVVPSDKQNHINVLFTSANLFAQEIEELQKKVDTLSLEEYKNKILSEMVDERDVIITNLRKDLDGMVREKNNV